MAKKKHKKKIQGNLSLKDRLAKHWENQNWVGFVELYYRDRTRSDQSPWANYLEDGLYNALTKTIIETHSGELIVDLANKLTQDAKGPDAGLLKQCATVALGLARGTILGDYPSAKEISLLPEPYRLIGQKLPTIKTKRSVKPTNPAEIVALKIRKLYFNLPWAKSIGPYNSLIKYCKELQGYLKNNPRLKIVISISNIAELLRQLKIKTTNNYDFSNLDAIYNHPSFQALGTQSPNHLLVAFWNLFCSLGQEKYGDDWANGARLLALNFMPDLDPDLATFFKGYLSLNVENDLPDFLEFFTRMMNKTNDIMEIKTTIDYFINKGNWIDQELYILYDILINVIYDSSGPELEQVDQDKMLSSLSKLTDLGTKYCQGFAVWNSKTIQVFENSFKNYFSLKSLNYLSNVKLPWKQFSVPLTLAILFFNPTLMIELTNQQLSTKFNQLTDDLLCETADYIAYKPIYVGSYWSRLTKILSNDDITRLYEAWLLNLIANTVKEMMHNQRNDRETIFEFLNIHNKPSRATWEFFDKESLEFGLKSDIKSGVIKAFLEVLAHAKYNSFPRAFTENSEKLVVFFDELSKAPVKLAVNLLIVVAKWFDLNKEYILVKLIDVIITNLIKLNDFNYLILGIYHLEDDSTKQYISELIYNRLSVIPLNKSTDNIRDAKYYFKICMDDDFIPYDILDYFFEGYEVSND
ncbi:MAG: hypothetical protein LBF58_05885 [Deltaproteobacteria bacterium]|jgi:hypothetical protein|nr:hypothetical protein [Deltaproteobacteria bacterium]